MGFTELGAAIRESWSGLGRWLVAHQGSLVLALVLFRIVWGFMGSTTSRFGHFLKGEDTGWDRQPRVLLQVRHVPENGRERFVERHEHEWPLARTQWTRAYLDAGEQGLLPQAPEGARQAAFDGLKGKLSFSTAPFAQDTEITGPLAAPQHGAIESPGMLESHYAPRARLRLDAAAPRAWAGAADQRCGFCWNTLSRNLSGDATSL